MQQANDETMLTAMQVVTAAARESDKSVCGVVTLIMSPQSMRVACYAEPPAMDPYIRAIAELADSYLAKEIKRRMEIAAKQARIIKP